MKLNERRWGSAGTVGASLVLGALGIWISLPDVRNLNSENPQTTTLIELRKQQAAEEGRKFQLRWQWKSLRQISPFLQKAVVYAEDDTFWKHDGVDWEAIMDAAEHDWHERSFARGASTITQQVAKNLYLSPSKNPIRKLRELFIAQRLDRELSKNRILEIYLNIAEWGDGVFGAEMAARKWFGCSAAELKPVQAARLASALPNPFKQSPDKRTRKLNRKAARLIRALTRAKLLDEEQSAAALAELGVAPPPRKVEPAAPSEAPAPALPALPPEEPEEPESEEEAR